MSDLVSLSLSLAKQGMTLGKAERLGIQTACLPVKRYTQASRTVLNINHGKVFGLITPPSCLHSYETSFIHHDSHHLCVAHSD